MKEKLEAFERLVKIMHELREKCPWDKKQDIHSLRNLTIEETYELADAITDKDFKGIKEELGDLLLHIIFYSKIAEEKGEFTMDEMINQECEKLINRHPHIYGDVKVENDQQVKENWERLKMKEGKTSVLSGVPASLPALIKAYRIQDKAKQVGFEWDHLDQVWEKVEEEIGELQHCVQHPEDAQRDADKIEDEFGDVLFALVNYARFLNVDPENALERTNRKFIRRFRYIEEIAKEQQRDLQTMTLTEMDALWDEAKTKEQSN